MESISKQDPRPSFDIMAMNTVPETGLDIGATATSQQRHAVEDLVASYRPEKTKVANVEMKLVTIDDVPVYHTPRRFSLREIVDKQVGEWIKEGIVEPCASEYSSQVVVIKKKDGTPRVCIDYRKINKKIVKDRYPLPLIEDQLDKLQDVRVVSTLDFRNGFFHVNVEENRKKYTSFVTHFGQYRFNKVPFGSLTNEGVALPSMDDLIIPAANEEEALRRPNAVFKVSSEHGLEINFKKCHFLQRNVEFLGHIISEGQIHPSSEKTKAVLRFPKPTTQKQLQSFLGLTAVLLKKSDEDDLLHPVFYE
ncbi:hypothetical protein Trydic_g3998 [Trypoxylus dichotomus]